MAADDVITKAKEVPSGAVFHRCALQVNPHHYDSTYRGNAPSGDPVDHAGAIVQKASDLGVSVFAISDHNHVGGVAAFRAAAERTWHPHLSRLRVVVERGYSRSVHLCPRHRGRPPRAIPRRVRHQRHGGPRPSWLTRPLWTSSPRYASRVVSRLLPT